MRYDHLLRLLVAILSLACAQCCTVLQFTNHSFSANAVRLMHALPIFEGGNGTLFLDFTASTHKCHADGGWQDFFDLGTHAGGRCTCWPVCPQAHLARAWHFPMHVCPFVRAEPWSAEKEAAEGKVCSKYFLGNIDSVVHESGLGWSELMEISIKRVRPQAIN